MDAFDIALLMANQHADAPVRMRYGTVAGTTEGALISVVPDGQENAVPAVKCCLPVEGSRVVLLVNGTEWLAASVVGGDCPYGVGDYFSTSNSVDPSTRWPGTKWSRVADRFLWGTSADARIGNVGGEQAHVLSYEEMPSHTHGYYTWYGRYNGGSVTGKSVAYDYPDYDPGGATLAAGGGAAHNNMPPYVECAIWHRIS